MDDLVAAVTRRWRSLDPLLPAARHPNPGSDVVTVAGAAGAAIHRTLTVDMPQAVWSALDCFALAPLIAGPAATRALDDLLTGWHASIAAQTAAAGDDSAAYITVPSRDVDLVMPLVRHGFTPQVVIAARLPGRTPPDPPPATIRQGTPDDIDTLVALSHRLNLFEQSFGNAYDRPDLLTHLRNDAETALRRPYPWVWFAEADGRTAGALIVTPPEETGWIGGYSDIQPMAYVSVAYVDPAVRGSGLGAALANTAHAALDDAGVALTLLHYGALNPLSGPFWHRMGYRPLWTGWHARPARTLR